ncbi:hypothetical protein DL96DRAFT_706171 [Flagelloscypha sp. PMI_526]|nr:hypothetical protein DL96DRAFT_706171 [Flagelloscypha sp. PMI_526]
MIVLKGGHERLFLGFENGLWLAPRHPSSQFSLHQVLDLRNVSQCTVLQDIGIVLVLAGKANILGANGATSPSVGACKIEELVNADNISSVTMVRLNDWNHVVTRFAAGVVDGRNLVIYLRKYTGKEYQVYHQHKMVCTVLEADIQAMQEVKKKGNWLSKALSSDPKWFSVIGYSVCGLRPIGVPFDDICLLQDVGGWAVRTASGYTICPLAKVKPTLDKAHRIH